MGNCDWAEEFGAAITVCDENGILLEVNKRSRAMFAPEDGTDPVGTNILECHPEPARSKVAEMLKTGATNVYTIEKNGRHKLIYQAPWYKDGRLAGLVELSLPIPSDLPHFVRDNK